MLRDPQLARLRAEETRAVEELGHQTVDVLRRQENRILQVAMSIYLAADEVTGERLQQPAAPLT
jgi:hypothetical protein